MKTQTSSNPPSILSAVLWVCVIVLLCLLPLRIISLGFLPPDDALRHAAKAVSGKSWQEILVMRPDITIDHNPGWHSILGAVHRATEWNPRALVVFSVVSMFALFALSPLPWLKRPETWLAALALLMLVFPYFAERLFVGRPLFLTMAVTIILLLLWTPQPGTTPETSRTPLLPGWKRNLFTTLCMAFSTWVHGSWYLLPLIPLAFFLARLWRKGMVLTFCWIAGTVLGAALTGHPWTFLHQSALIPFLALGQNAPVNSLVGEFQPFTGGAPALVLIGIVLIWRKFSGRSLSSVWQDPIFCLALVSWLLGIKVVRFWLDWGLPALALWLAFQFQELLYPAASTDRWRRVIVATVAAAALFLEVANDRNARWSQYGKMTCLDAKRPEHKEWLPEPGGILYAVNLSVFYQTFFTNPHGDWRYILGFEPSFMRPEDLAVYQELWRTLNALRACRPWVERMTPADRFVLFGPPQTRPAFPELEWYYAAENTWVGRRGR